MAIHVCQAFISYHNRLAPQEYKIIYGDVAQIHVTADCGEPVKTIRQSRDNARRELKRTEI